MIIEENVQIGQSFFEPWIAGGKQKLWALAAEEPLIKMRRSLPECSALPGTTGTRTCRSNCTQTY
jgi:hypothetical protein